MKTVYLSLLVGFFATIGSTVRAEDGSMPITTETGGSQTYLYAAQSLPVSALNLKFDLSDLMQKAGCVLAITIDNAGFCHYGTCRTLTTDPSDKLYLYARIGGFFSSVAPNFILDGQGFLVYSAAVNDSADKRMLKGYTAVFVAPNGVKNEDPRAHTDGQVRMKFDDTLYGESETLKSSSEPDSSQSTLYLERTSGFYEDSYVDMSLVWSSACRK